MNRFAYYVEGASLKAKSVSCFKGPVLTRLKRIGALRGCCGKWGILCARGCSPSPLGNNPSDPSPSPSEISHVLKFTPLSNLVLQITAWWKSHFRRQRRRSDIFGRPVKKELGPQMRQGPIQKAKNPLLLTGSRNMSPPTFLC